MCNKTTPVFRYDVNPYDWLKDVLSHNIQEMHINKIKKLLPHNWKKKRSQTAQHFRLRQINSYFITGRATSRRDTWNLRKEFPVKIFKIKHSHLKNQIMYYLCKFSESSILYDGIQQTSRQLETPEIDCLKNLFSSVLEDSKMLLALKVNSIQPHKFMKLPGNKQSVARKFQDRFRSV